MWMEWKSVGDRKQNYKVKVREMGKRGLANGGRVWRYLGNGEVEVLLPWQFGGNLDLGTKGSNPPYLLEHPGRWRDLEGGGRSTSHSLYLY